MTQTVKRIEKLVFIFTLLSFSVSGGIFIIKLIIALSSGSTEHLSYTNYILSLLQCALGIFALFIPRALHKKYNFQFSEHIKLTYFLFLYCAIFLGEVKNYYITVPLWDDILHGFSGIMSGLFAFMLTSVALSGHNTNTKALPPAFIALFAFTFAVTIGALWEIYEFSFDLFLELNMQKYRQNDGVPLVGREALFDTMKDIIIDTVGSASVSIVGYTAMKKKQNWLDRYSASAKR